MLFLDVLKQVGLLYLFILIGYMLAKMKLVRMETSKILSQLCVYLFLPCTAFKSFSGNFRPDNLRAYGRLMLISFAVLLVLLAVNTLLARLITKEKYQRAVTTYSLMTPNFSYCGYSIAEGLYGTGGLLTMVMCGLPISIYNNTLGFCSLTKRKLSLRKLINPVLIAIALGIIIGLLEIRLPDFLTAAVQKSSGCLMPVSMILAGITISGFELKKMFTDWRVYVVSALRLLIIPLTVMAALSGVLEKDVLRIMVLLYACPCGMNSIVFARLVDEDCEFGARLVMLSNTFSIVTIPLCMMIIQG